MLMKPTNYFNHFLYKIFTANKNMEFVSSIFNTCFKNLEEIK